MLKVELHTHTAEDPVDRIAHSATELIDRACVLGYDALAITLHDRQYDVARLQPYARERGLVLIPGVERTVEGKHVLLLNFPAHATAISSFDELARLRARHRGLVVAPHPFFPARSCLRRRLDEHPDLFDAVEWNAMYTSTVNFNAGAARWAARRGVPLVGNCDVHQLRQLGTTCSLVDAEAQPDAICHAIAQGRVRLETRPLRWRDAAAILGGMAGSQLAGGRLLAPSFDAARGERA
jgi:predicted metal-dependent phosphoesterase TrpH